LTPGSQHWVPLIGTKYATIRRLPLQGSSRCRPSILAMIRSVDSRTSVGRQ
jgi:hypothetical protein